MTRTHTPASERLPPGPACRLTVVVGEQDTWHHRPTYLELVHRARAAGLAGASVFRGIEGYGASRHMHTTRLLSLSEDLPVSVVLIDTRERIEAFLPEVDELLTEGISVLEDVTVHRYLGRTPTP